MNTKKKNSKNMDRYKTLFFEAGLVVSLFIVMSAFEWKTYDENKSNLYESDAYDIPEEIVAITRQEPEPPRPEPQTTLLEIVDDKIEVQENLEINAEDNQKTRITYTAPPIETEDAEVIDVSIFTIVEEQPTFPDGEEAMMNYLGNNIRYPQVARENGIQGTVYLTFVVESNGLISNVKTLRGIGGGCDEEAVRVVRNMPLWNPGKQRGRPVRVQFNLPIRFILQG